MAADREQSRSWSLRAGAYLGEISALSFLTVPPQLSSLPLLLAGTGSQLLVYDVKSGALLNSFYVFQGIRVHGIALSPAADPVGSPAPPVANFFVAVFGERRVKLLRLHIDAQLHVRLELVHRLPQFDHWVLDVCFLKEDAVVVVGLSDNSVVIWDIGRSIVVQRVRSSEKCLLYSMRMWGDSVEFLRVASGTIYNEIIIWKFSPQSQSLLSSSMEPSTHCTSGCKDIQLLDHQYVAIHLSRLTGHEGSILRIAWSSDGTKLISVSDDRSARIWIISGQRQDFGNSVEILGHDISANLTLFGHNARIWDCYISDSIVITAGEDCTCRVWGMDGNQLSMIKEHIGRGIWRCLYDPISSLLVTAGFDSAIKVHLLGSSTLGEATGQNGVLNEFKDMKEIFTICAPKVSQQLGLMDSKSEYIRCMCFSRENIIYVATNNGYLHRVELSNPGNVRWAEVARVSKEAIVCMDLINSSEFSLDVEDMVAIGDGKGNATVVKLINDDPTPKLALCLTWTAEKERQLLGIYWSKSLGCGHLFTADPRGAIKLWKIKDGLQSGAGNNNMDLKVSLVAVFTSCFGARIMCLDALIKEEILICGDQRGNLTVFPLPEGLTAGDSRTAEKIPLVNHFKGAHGISCVTSILIAAPSFNHADIRTTGGDGCICYFKYGKNLQRLEFIGMKKLKELSTIQSVFANSTSEEELTQGNYAVGFTSADFIVWDLVNEIKMLQIPCGGWRRSYSYHLGAVPEYQNCFAYMKDHKIHIHRLWVPAHGRQLLPQVLHIQSHGREIHSLRFISSDLQSNQNKSHLWIATGCEDGTVRLTRYVSTDIGSWSESRLLGEHVGGSAVRSVFFISKIYTTTAGQTCSADDRSVCDASLDSIDDQLLLISVGAKQVLTSWILQYRATDIQSPFKRTQTESEHKSSLCMSEFSFISFQWLSTHMPPKFASLHKKVDRFLEISEKRNAPTVKSAPMSESSLAECKKPKLNSFLMDQHENDWRYLAVTAFLVKHTDKSRLTVCFIVVSCSDTTLTLRALLLPYRLWIDVALLVPQTSPVLALQHMVVPGFPHSTDSVQSGNVYIVISGSTDGSITFWDLTETVEYFMQLVSELQPQMLIDCQKRPQTGRGSQGGRWWRSVMKQPSDKGVRDALTKTKGGDNKNGHSIDKIAPEASSILGSCHFNSQTGSSHAMGSANPDIPGMQSDVLPSVRQEVQPLYVLNAAHQSGVNCLHVSRMNDDLHSESDTVYCVVSGGDDQAVHCVGFELGVQMTSPDCSHAQPTNITNLVQDGMFSQPSGASSIGNYGYRNFNCKLRVLFREMISSAHSSAVKGIWTDGLWAFSTGLDQRVRCWKVGHYGMLTQHAHLIISVPEPETLDAIFCVSPRSRYQIAVAGRGLQMVEFCASCDSD